MARDPRAASFSDELAGAILGLRSSTSDLGLTDLAPCARSWPASFTGYAKQHAGSRQDTTEDRRSHHSSTARSRSRSPQRWVRTTIVR